MGKSKLGFYQTSTQKADGFDGYQVIKIGGENFNNLVEAGRTFTFQRTFEDEPNPDDWRGIDVAVTVKLTCRAETKQRGGIYYYAYWRDNRYNATRDKKLRKKYLGKGLGITLARLEAIAKGFADSPLF